MDKENVYLEKCGRKRKSNERHQYDEHTKAELGKYTVIHGNKKAVERFSIRLVFSLPKASGSFPSINHLWREKLSC